MTPRFIRLTLDEFADLLQRFDFTRRIDGVHMHHTWRPNHAQYRGETTIEGMWRFHTREKGWRDIAQHVSIGPDGSIWTGRDWNLPPASAAGFNGNTMAGPFMVETIGDFDRGRDRLEGPQLADVIGVIAQVQERFGLGLDSLRFHGPSCRRTAGANSGSPRTGGSRRRGSRSGPSTGGRRSDRPTDPRAAGRSDQCHAGRPKWAYRGSISW
jgi:hypothetical protein